MSIYRSNKFLNMKWSEIKETRLFILNFSGGVSNPNTCDYMIKI